MPFVLPQPAPRQTIWDQLGFATGVGTDLLLKAILGGQLGLPPQQGRPPGTAGPVTSSGDFYSQPQPPRPIRLGPFQVQPDVDRQLQQAQLQKAQRDLDPNSPMNQLLRAYTNQITNQVPSTSPNGFAQTLSDSVFSAPLRTLRDAAVGGDEAAVERIRRILELLEE